MSQQFGHDSNLDNLVKLWLGLLLFVFAIGLWVLFSIVDSRILIIHTISWSVALGFCMWQLNKIQKLRESTRGWKHE